MEEFRILSPTAILGYGFPLKSFEQGMKRRPHVIAVDAGSTDPGPYYLGAGVSFTDRRAVKRDLEIILEAGWKEKIPVIIGTAGGSGSKIHVTWTIDIIREIAEEKNTVIKVAVIYSDVPASIVRQRMEEGRVEPLEPAPELKVEVLGETGSIVGQMGMEPIISALEKDVDVVITGRAYDPAVFAALPVKKGYNEGLALHLGKILECAAIAAVPGSGSDCMFGSLYRDHFTVEPLNPARKCTILSVSAHTLYEKTNPYMLPGPGGILDLTQTSFEQLEGGKVRVKGSRFVPSKKYSVKLEGARKIGYRTISIAGVRDPIMIEKIDEVIAGVRERVADNFSIDDFKYHLEFRIYGKNGVMGALEPVKEIRAHELGIIIEAVADTQDNANTICSFARSTMLHYGYEGRISTAGNLALPYSPSDFRVGEVYVFSIYHLIEMEDPEELFKTDFVTIGREVGA